MKVLVVNSGSSSLKVQLMETETGEVFCNAYCERIGLAKSFVTYKVSDKKIIENKGGEGIEYAGEHKIVITRPMPTHKEAFQLCLDAITDKNTGVVASLKEIKAVGHRCVNFGEKFNKSVVVTPKVLAELKKNVHFAPLHDPAAILGMEVCMSLMKKVKHVAVFDTAFHSTMPEKAYMYALPYELYEKNKIRRYGAHGTSHRYIALKMKEIMGSLEGKKIISCHLGGGSSICAIKDGICVDTSMGYTPLAGVVMGTRSGDVDASVFKEIMTAKKLDAQGTTDLLNKKSGLVGICGYSDMRDIESNIDNPKVKLAFDMMVYSIKKYIGAYAAAMNGVDAIVFTAGIGEKDEIVREAVCKDMEYLGLEFDSEKNKKLHKPFDNVIEVSKKKSKVKVYRIPTNEEYMIAMDTAELAK